MMNRKMKKILAAVLAAMMLPVAAGAFAEGTENAAAAEKSTEAAAEVSQAAETAAETVAQTSTEVTAETGTASIADNQRLEAAYTLALNAINKEDYETAKEYLDICFAYCDPQTNPAMYADLLLKRACINVIEEKTDMALLNLDAAVRIQPDLADAYLVRTQIYTTASDFANAISNLEMYIELTQDATMYATVAQLYEASGDMLAAQEAFDKYAAAAGEDNQEAGFLAGLYRLNNGKLEEAIEAFQAYAEDKDYGAGANYNIGLCKMNLGDYAGAIEAFDACEKMGGEYEGLLYNRGTCYFLSGDWAKSAENFTKSIEKKEYVEDSQYNLGICRMQQEDYKGAVAAFDELVKGTKDQEGVTLNDAVYYFRAVCNEALGNLEDAIKDLTICIEHEYELAQTYYERAQVYAAMGDTEKQTSDLENSLKYTK